VFLLLFARVDFLPSSSGTETMPSLSKVLGAATTAAVALAAEPSGIQRCQTGADDILGERKAFAIQVCNLFGSTCVLNHPATASDNCATEALSIAAGECKLYPIFEYQDRAVRTGDAAVEELSTIGDLGCSVSSSGDGYSWSGACVSVQCSLGSDAFAGPAMTKTGNGNARTTGVTDTSAADTFMQHTLAELPDAADQIKTAFLVRTGDHVATTSTGASGNSGDTSYSVGSLPTSDGNNYGPVACPSAGNLLSSSTADGITAENLRMCGSTGKWVYFNAMNFLVDATHYATMDNDEASSGSANMAAVPFLFGKSVYRSGDAMDDARKIYLHADSTASSDVLLTSKTITPQAGDVAPFKDEIAGCWRNYGVVFYCDKYDRTDLTACPEENQKMFYVGDPNPAACFGTCATGEADDDGKASSATGVHLSLAAVASGLLQMLVQ
jgi:hypothetical protein